MSSTPSSSDLLIGHLAKPTDAPSPKWCPYATTLLGYSTVYRATTVIQVRCKRWGCRVCGERRAKHLSMRVADAQPNKLMTLTVNPAVERSPRSAWESNTPMIPRLIKKLRARFGEIEYFRVLEVTKAGWPHWHFLLRSGYIPQKVISSEWHKLSGASIVDIRQVDTSFRAYKYVVKYLAKQKYVPWTDRRVTWSTSFFPPSQPYEKKGLELADRARLDKHPHYVLTWLAAPAERQNLTQDCVLIPGVNLVSDLRTKRWIEDQEKASEDAELLDEF